MRMFPRTALAASRRLFLRNLRRFDARLVARVIVREALSEDHARRARALGEEHGWDAATRRPDRRG